MQGLEVFTMKMPELDKERNIRVWVPSTYETSGDKRYPVIYMHDAQNLFESETSSYGDIWDVHTAIEGLMKAHGFDGAIVVGIDHGGSIVRLDEYSPWESDRYNELKVALDLDRNVGGEGAAYGEFLVSTLKPYIDERYRTLPDRENTAVAGSSMGGFISLYLGATYPEIYSKVGAFSTAGWFNSVELMSCLKSFDPKWLTRWYLDVGTNETSNPEKEDFNVIYIETTKSIADMLRKVGVPENQIKVVIEEGAIHNEVDWAKRLPAALMWLFEIT